MSEENRHKKYVRYIKDNAEDISAAVNRVYENKRENIKTKFLGLVVKAVTDKKAAHYEWIQESIKPFDHSGSLVRKGSIDTDETVGDFLKEYTGDWIATHEPGCEKEWVTYDDVIYWDICGYISKMLTDTVESIVRKHFPSDEITEDDFEDILDEWHDDIEDLTYVGFTMFTASGIAGFTLTARIPIKDVISEYGRNNK